MSKDYPNILLVSGNGRNSGKTSLACKIIEKHAESQHIIGLKISPHFHALNENEIFITKKNGYNILKEESRDSGKDSSRMLIAGAKEVYFIQSDDENLDEAFHTLMKIIGNDSLIVCESGGLRRKIHPGVFLLLNRKDVTEFKPGARDLKILADRLVTFDDGNFDLDPGEISVSDNSWKIGS
ncbi:hypothetical protein ACFLRY_01330 [Bacteroidota bacterium]